jgi:copper homeostasis protein (lipoprotein)
VNRPRFVVSRSIGLVAGGAIALIAFGFASASATEKLIGTATYSERVALPQGAVLEVSLEDVSLADAPSQLLGSARIEDLGSPPFSFQIPYDPEAVDERHSYAVRATIRVDGKLMFTTDTIYPVLTRGAGNQVELLLRRVGGEDREAPVGPLGELPSSFEGELPCADCPGIYYRLDLFPDRVFFLRMTYLGRGTGAVRDTIGSWVLDRDDDRLILYGGTETPIFFHVIDPNTIRKLDIEGRDIESSLSYELRRKVGLGPLEIRLEMRGMYRYMADAGLFEECVSGRTFRVAMEADNAALERAYLAAQRQPGEALLVSMRGRISDRPAMEGDATVLTVVPERFININPGETCGARGTVSELEDNYWKLTALGPHRVPVLEGQREPHIVFYSERGQVVGTGGCNRFTGGYEIDDERLSFSVLATTMMACVDGTDVDGELMAALEATRSFRKSAHYLELLDEDGNTVARFEARELP